MDLLLKNPTGIIKILDGLTDSNDREKLATTIVKIYESKNQAPTLLKALISQEIENCESSETLFRGSSVTLKAIDIYMKLAGRQYLLDNIKPFVKEYYKDKRSLEIDPLKVEKNEDAKKNLKILKNCLDAILDKIFVSPVPNSLREVFQHISKELNIKFKDIKGIYAIGVNSLFFLRFVCAAINSPKLFNIMDDHPDNKVAKTLTLIAKTIMKLSVYTEEDVNPNDPLHKFYTDNLPKMLEFVNKMLEPTEDTEFNPVPGIDLYQQVSSLVDYFEEKFDKLEKKYR